MASKMNKTYLQVNLCYFWDQKILFFINGSTNALITINVYDYVLNRPSIGKYALPWIYNILVGHGHHVISQEHVTHMLDSLCKVL